MISRDEEALSCPLAAVDRRLDDLHRQWHQASDAYFNPEAFRVAIQTAIQTSRTVSFILQSNKCIIPDFERWYAEWQDRLRAIPLMKWMVEARNTIEKVGDLETHSWVRAEILGSHLPEGPRFDVPANLFAGSKEILDGIPANALGDHLRRDGILRIERQWVENTLPEYELLDAVGIAYGHLALLVADAHRQLGLPTSMILHAGEFGRVDLESTGGRLPCMIEHKHRRKIDLWIATGVQFEMEEHQKNLDIEEAEHHSERYGIDSNEVYGKERDVDSVARALFKTARKMFLVDEHHIFAVFMFRGEKLVDLRQINIEEHGQKYVIMRRLADVVLQRGADAVVTISEVWTSKADPKNPYRRVANAPDRGEALTATLVRKVGEPLYLSADIQRTEDAVTLGDTYEISGGSHYAFAPIYEVWGREMPIADFPATHADSGGAG